MVFRLAATRKQFTMQGGSPGYSQGNFEGSGYPVDPQSLVQENPCVSPMIPTAIDTHNTAFKGLNGNFFDHGIGQDLIAGILHGTFGHEVRYDQATQHHDLPCWYQQ